MNDKHNTHLTENAKALRRNMTKQERHLWYDFLKTLPLTIHRQKVLGNYIVDFYCAEAKLVIELDGSQHFMDSGREYDRERDDYLSSLDLTVKRYSNADIDHDFDSVCRDILVLLGMDG